jgi:hypothetical protein
VPRQGKAEKRSAFLKKSAQKTFVNLGHGRCNNRGPEETKVFWFFFSKKNRFRINVSTCESPKIPADLAKP